MDIPKLLQSLNAHNVRYVVIGRRRFRFTATLGPRSTWTSSSTQQSREDLRVLEKLKAKLGSESARTAPAQGRAERIAESAPTSRREATFAPNRAVPEYIMNN